MGQGYVYTVPPHGRTAVGSAPASAGPVPRVVHSFGATTTGGTTTGGFAKARQVPVIVEALAAPAAPAVMPQQQQQATKPESGGASLSSKDEVPIRKVAQGSPDVLQPAWREELLALKATVMKQNSIIERQQAALESLQSSALENAKGMKSMALLLKTISDDVKAIRAEQCSSEPTIIGSPERAEQPKKEESTAATSSTAEPRR